MPQTRPPASERCQNSFYSLSAPFCMYRLLVWRYAALSTHHIWHELRQARRLLSSNSLSPLIPTIHTHARSHISTHANNYAHHILLPVNKPLIAENEREDIIYFPFQFEYLLILFSFFLFPLPFSFLSFLVFLCLLSISPCLVYLLSQRRKSRDYQRDNPSGRGLLLPASTQSPLFFPLLLPSVPSYFLSEAGGECLMMGGIPLSAWSNKTILKSIQSYFSYPSFLWPVFYLHFYLPEVEKILTCCT